MFYTADKKVQVTQDNLEILDNYIESLQTIRKIAENCKNEKLVFEVLLDPFLESYIIGKSATINLFQLPSDCKEMVESKSFHKYLHKENSKFVNHDFQMLQEAFLNQDCSECDTQEQS